MRIYIHTDLEGVTGIGAAGQIDPAGPDYAESCRNLMLDVNAAVDGVIAGGATHVTVLDSHGGGGNFVASLLDPRAEQDPRDNRKWWGKLDASYAGTLFIGAHAMAGTMNAFLNHTQSSRDVYNFILNRRRMGELVQWAIVAGNWGVPLLMVSGDEAACVEARQFFDPVEVAAVKRGIGRNRAELVDPSEARERIRAAAARAMQLVGVAQPFVPAKPMECVLEVTRCNVADRLARKPGVERIEARTLRKVTLDPLDMLM